MRSVLFGVDSLTFRILHPLIERGDPPNFKKLSLEGCNELHLLLLPNEGITFRMDLGSKWFWNEASRIQGTHQKHGVLYAYGRGIKRGFKAPNAEIYDIVPTVLCSLGLPLPHAFDGCALDELFVQPDQTPIPAVVNGGAEDGLARRRLKKLLEN